MTVTGAFLSEDGVFDELLPAAPLGDPAECIGQDAEAGLVAWHQMLTHVAWRRLRWIRDTARARADVLERRPDPDVRVIAVALGWSVSMAASRVELADGVLDRLPRVGEAMRAGLLEESKAGKFVTGLRDVDDEQARAVVDRLIERAPRLGVYELEQEIAAAVKDVDPDGAENRRNAAVARARVRTRTAPSGAVEIHGLDLDPRVAVPAFERLAAISDEVHGRLRAAGADVPLSRVQAHVYLRLLHGCPDGHDDLTIADHVTEELLRPPRGEDDDDSDEGLDGTAPDDDGPNGPDQGPDDESPDDDGPNGPHQGPDDEGPNDDGPNDDGPDDDGPDDEGPCAGDPDGAAPHGSATPTDLLDLDALAGGHRSGRDDDRTGTSPPPWQPGDLPPEPPPDDSPDPTIPSREPPPPLGTRVTDRGLEFRPGTLRTSLFTVLGLDRAHGRLPHGALCGGDAHAMAWARTCGQFRVLLYDGSGALEWVLLVRAPHRPGADPRYRRHVVELTAYTAQLDTLEVESRLVGHCAELARRTLTALAAQRARPPEDHPARTTADTRRRVPGAELARYVQARDRTCRFPMCTVPAVACHLDHTHDWLLGGHTRGNNLGALSVGDHLRKHDPRSGWTVGQPLAGVFVWTSPTGTRHVVEPEPYRPLHPVARDRFDHGVTDTHQPRTETPWRPRTDEHGRITEAARATLEVLDRRRRERERRPPSPYDDDPPF